MVSELQRDLTFTWNGQQIECESGIDWGIAEQSNGLIALLINAPGGILTGKQYRMLGEIVGDEGLIKNSRRMAPLLLVPKEKVREALSRLEEAGLSVANLHKSIRNIVACPGKGFSANARGDTLELAAALDQAFYGTILPWDFKIGISGCPRNCSGVQCHDIGLMAEPRGKFSLWLGGTESGMNPEHGVLVTKGIPREKVTDVVRAVLLEYVKGAASYPEIGKRIRLYQVIKKAGIEEFKQAVEEVL